MAKAIEINSISVEKGDNNSATLTVKVAVDQIQSRVEGRIRSMARTAKIDGFRKGKVPVSHIRAQYGAGIQQEVINDTIRDTVFEAIKQEDVRAVGMPNIDDVKLENDFLVYQATLDVFPEIDVQGIDKIDVERQTASVNDEDVDEMVENLRQQRQEFSEKEGASAEGDQVTIDFVGRVDGEEFEGGKAEDFKLTLGAGTMIPGFEDGITGMSAGEEKTITVTFPEDYQAENLAGKEAEFDITVKTVEEPKLPELNDEFFELFGVSEGGLDQLKTDVRKNMEREIKSASRNQIKQATFDALLEQNEIDIPEAMLEQEVNRQRQQMMQRFAQQFGGGQNLDPEMLPRELFEEEALRTARLGVLISRVIEENNLEVDAERVKTFIEEMAENYEDPAEVIEHFSTDENERNNIEAVVLEDQVVDFLLDKGKVTDKEVSYKDLLASQQQSRGMM